MNWVMIEQAFVEGFSEILRIGDKDRQEWLLKKGKYYYHAGYDLELESYTLSEVSKSDYDELKRIYVKKKFK